MTERHELRWGGVAGLGFVGLIVIAGLLRGFPPTVDSTHGEVATYFATGRGQLLLVALLLTAAAALVIWFAAAFAEAIREREERSEAESRSAPRKGTPSQECRERKAEN